MTRLTLGDTAFSRQSVRPAAIAAMGQRLAAAGPRTRQLVNQRYHPPAKTTEEVDESVVPWTARGTPALVADRAQAFIRDIAPLVPPSPHRRMLTAISRAAALCIMAAAGFALVLVAQNPRWSAGRHVSARKDAAVAAAKAQPEPTAFVPSPPARIADAGAEGAPQPPLAPTESRSPAVQTPQPPQPAALAPKALPGAPDAGPPAAPAPRRLHVQLAVAHRPRQEVAKGVHMVARREAPHYELPRWLTEDRPIIMSPPPHELEAPAAHQTEKPHPVLPPLPRPRLIYASAAYPPLPPGRGIYGGVYPYGSYRPQAYPP